MAKNPQRDRNWHEPIRRSEVATDFGITLARIQWDFFATMSFKGNVPRPNICYGLAFRWLQELAKVGGVPYKRLLIALRGEEGEMFGRFHFHCLIGGTATRNYHTLQHQAEWLWKIQTGGARVDVRQYGRVSPSNEQRGIHWYWLGVPLILVVASFLWLYTHLDFVSQKLHNGFLGLFYHVTASAIVHPLVKIPSLPGGPSAPSAPSSVPERRISGGQVHSEEFGDDTNTLDDVYCTGYVDLPNCTLVFLSDGRIADAKNGDIQFIKPELVRVFGHDYRVYSTAEIERLHPEMNFTAGRVPSGLALSGVGLASSSTSLPAPPIILPVHDYRTNLHNIKTAGLPSSSFQNSFSQETGSER